MERLDQNHEFQVSRDLARAILTSFGDALLEFDNCWHAGWHSPANERACVGRVAEALRTKYSSVIDAWSEISLDVLYRSAKQSPPESVANKGPIDLVLTDRGGGRLRALVELKTHAEIEQDRLKLEAVQKTVNVPMLVVVGCQESTEHRDEQSSIQSVQHWIRCSQDDVNLIGWNFEVERDKSPIHINEGDKTRFVCPFLFWRTYY